MKPTFLGLSGVVLWSCLAFSSIITEAMDLKHPKLKDVKSKGIPGRYIVEFENKNNNASSVMIQSVHDTFSETVKVTNKFNHKFFHAAAIDLGHTNSEVIEHILELPNVKAIYPIKECFLDNTFYGTTSRLQKRDTATSPKVSQALAQVDRVRSELGHKGKGIFVGIIDTGKRRKVYLFFGNSIIV